MKLIIITIIVYIVGVLIFWLIADYDKQFWCSIYYMWQKWLNLGFVIIAMKQYNGKSFFINGILEIAAAIAIDRILFEFGDIIGIEPFGGWEMNTRLHAITIIVIFIIISIYSRFKDNTDG